MDPKAGFIYGTELLFKMNRRTDMENKKVTRPVTVRVNQLKSDIQTSVLKSELPPFMIEMILSEYLAGIKIVAQKEYAQDQAEWEKACKEGENNG